MEAFYSEQLDPAQSGRWGRKIALLAKDFRTADAKHSRSSPPPSPMEEVHARLGGAHFARSAARILHHRFLAEAALRAAVPSRYPICSIPFALSRQPPLPVGGRLRCSSRSAQGEPVLNQAARVPDQDHHRVGLAADRLSYACSWPIICSCKSHLFRAKPKTLQQPRRPQHSRQ